MRGGSKTKEEVVGEKSACGDRKDARFVSSYRYDGACFNSGSHCRALKNVEKTARLNG